MLVTVVTVTNPVSASCTGVNVGSDCYGVLSGCQAGGSGVGHQNGYDWCYASAKSTSSFKGVCSNVEFTWDITCIGLITFSGGNCVGIQTYGGDGSDQGFQCLA